MAKFKPMELLSGLRGKVCMHSDMAFVERNGTMFTRKHCNPRTSAPTEKELAVRDKFKAAHTAVVNLPDEQVNAYKEAFKKQTKYKTLQGYMFAKEYEKVQ